MAVRLGMKGFLYRNTGDYDSPSWVAVNNVRDLTLSLEKGEADVTTRSNDGWRATLGTLKDASIEFQMVWDTADAAFAAIQEAWFQDATIEFAILDGPLPGADNGNLPETPQNAPQPQGLRATCSVMTFSRSENLEEAMMTDVAIKPTYAEHPPEWMGTAQSGGGGA